MRTFALFVTVLLFLAAVISATPQLHSKPRARGHHGRRRRNTTKFFGYVRTHGNSYLHNQTELAREFMHAHNWVRNEFKLPALKWDENLAGFARKYLMQRYNDCKLMHSTANYGENLFWGRKLHWTPSDAVYYWYDEKNWYNFSKLSCLPAKSCEHFTQIVWRDSTHLGCAVQHCRNNGAGMLIACEYDPAGNYVNENPLQVHT